MSGIATTERKFNQVTHYVPSSVTAPWRLFFTSEEDAVDYQTAVDAHSEFLRDPTPIPLEDLLREHDI